MWVELHNEWDIEHSETCNQQKINNMSEFENHGTSRVEAKAIYANPLLEDLEKNFAACLSTAVRKNHDYGGSNNDPYANFRNSTIAGVSVERGILVRLMDKMSRISTLLDKEAMVKDEAVDDTIDDAINYLAILKSYRKRNK
jgi:hypothetical protein